MTTYSQALQGSFSGIVWGNDAYYLKVGLDANGGTNFQTMGVTQFLSVPYAMYADSARSSGSGHTYQILSFSHDTLYLSNGGNVYLGGYRDTIVYQNLSINNDTLSISHGNNIVLPPAHQTLSINNDTLSISNGNKVVLPSSNVVVKFNGVPISDPSINHVMISPNYYLTSTNYRYQLAVYFQSFAYEHMSDSMFLDRGEDGTIFAQDSLHFANNGPYYVRNNSLTNSDITCINSSTFGESGFSPGTIFAIYSNTSAVYYFPLNAVSVILNNPCTPYCQLSGAYSMYQILPNNPNVTGFPFTTAPIKVTFTRY